MYIIVWMYSIKFSFFFFFIIVKSILLFFSRIIPRSSFFERRKENSTGKKNLSPINFRDLLFETKKVKVFRVSRSSLIHTTRPRPTASHLPCPTNCTSSSFPRFSGVSRKKRKKEKKRKMSALHSPVQCSLFTDIETARRFARWKILFDSSFGGPEAREERRGESRRLTVPPKRSSKDFLFPLMVEIDDRMVEGKKVRGDARGIN